MCKIEVNGVSITLTKEQLEEINKQQNIIRNYKDIKTLEDACKILNCDIPTNINDKLKTICRAINSLIDNNKNFPDWNNSDEYKYYPYFKLVGSGWVLSSSSHYSLPASVGVGYLKTSESALYIGNQFLDLFKELLNEKY